MIGGMIGGMISGMISGMIGGMIGRPTTDLAINQIAFSL